MLTLVLTLVLPVSFVRACLISLLLFLLIKLYLSPRSRSLPLPPGPFGVPLLGFLPFITEDFHVTLTKLVERYGSIYQIFLGNKRVVVLSDARLIKEAFRQPVFSGRPDTELTRILQGYGEFLNL